MFEVLPFDSYERRSVYGWYKLKGEIDFTPKYQRRGDVWDVGMKQLLIDSIINKFDIPKFYFHLLDKENAINKSNKHYAVIDGKQRLACIFDFINGVFALSNEFVYFRNNRVKLQGLKYNDILYKYPDIAYSFQEYVLDVVYVVTDEEEKIELFFSRLNSGKPLNNAEKRKAMVGFLNNKIEKFVNVNPFFMENLAFKNIRNNYNDIMAKLILLEAKGGFINMDKKTLDNLYDNNRDENEDIVNIINKVDYNLIRMSEVFNNKDKLLKVKSSIPVYYWIIRNNHIKANLLKKFLKEFDELRKISKEADILEYNKYQQKGTDKKESMEYRYKVLLNRLQNYKASYN